MTNNLIPRNSGHFDMNPFNFFDDFRRNSFDSLKENLGKTDIRETDNEFIVSAELPGIPKDKIDVNYENGILTVKGEYQADSDEKDKKGKLVRSERSYNSVFRQFSIENVKQADIHAKFEDGILKITLPKDKETPVKNNSIPIN